jgi:hypothetical protein
MRKQREKWASAKRVMMKVVEKSLNNRKPSWRFGDY